MSILQDLLKDIPTSVHEYFNDIEAEAKILRFLQKTYLKYSPIKQADENQRAWECSALYFHNTGRQQQAITIIKALYNQILQYQIQANKYVHKGMPLVWLYEFYRAINFKSIADKYMFLTCVEDAIRDKGNFNRKAGVYFRLNFHFGMSDAAINKLGKDLYGLYLKHKKKIVHPEFYLQLYGDSWKNKIPSAEEYNYWDINRFYFDELLKKINDRTGKKLESIAEYLFMNIPGATTIKRAKTPSTDYDLLCVFEGNYHDFRRELGNYIICECKNWKKPANFSTVAKFMRVLDSTKCQSGILFSKNGLSGTGKNRHGEREIIKYFQDRGKVIIVISEADLNSIQKGENFIKLLKIRYEKIRFDLYEK